MNSELMQRVRTLEAELSSLRAEVVRLYATPAETARSLDIRLARTYNDSYPGSPSANTFPATLIDATYTETTGTQTPTVTERDTGNIITVHNVWDEAIPVNTIVPVWRQNQRWWTCYGTGSGEATDCAALQAFTGHSPGVFKLLGNSTLDACEWFTVCEALDEGLGAISSDLSGDIVAQKTDNSCGWATICDTLNTITQTDSVFEYMLTRTSGGACAWATPCGVLTGAFPNYSPDTWQIIVHNPNSPGTPGDDTCEWMTICTYLNNSLSTISAAASTGKVLGQGSGATCGWVTVCNLLQNVTNWTNDEAQILIHNPGTVDSGVDDTCEWGSICDAIELLPTVSADITNNLLVKTDDGLGTTGCGFATICDTLEQGVTGWTDGVMQFLIHVDDDTCQWLSMCDWLSELASWSDDTYQILVHKPGTTDSGVDDTCEFVTPCQLLLDSNAIPAVTSDIQDSLLVLTDDGMGSTGCGWATACDALTSMIADSGATLSRVLGKTAAGACGWFVPTGGGGNFCTDYTGWATSEALDTSKQWVAKLVYTGGAWTCVAVEVKAACT